MMSSKLVPGPMIERRAAITPISLPRKQSKAAGRTTLTARASSNGHIRIGINGAAPSFASDSVALIMYATLWSSRRAVKVLLKLMKQCGKLLQGDKSWVAWLPHRCEMWQCITTFA